MFKTQAEKTAYKAGLKKAYKDIKGGRDFKSTRELEEMSYKKRGRYFTWNKSYEQGFLDNALMGNVKGVDKERLMHDKDYLQGVCESPCWSGIDYSKLSLNTKKRLAKLGFKDLKDYL